MELNNFKYLIGERIKVEGEKETGVVTRIDEQRGLIYVLFKRMRQEIFPFPESINQGLLIPLVSPK